MYSIERNKWKDDPQFSNSLSQYLHVDPAVSLVRTLASYNFNSNSDKQELLHKNNVLQTIYPMLEQIESVRKLTNKTHPLYGAPTKSTQ